jgi:hypothetical protein
MKLAVFVALALVATGVSAQNIEVTTELLKDGKVIEHFTGSKPNGEVQTLGNLKSHPYRKEPEQGDKSKPELGSFDTGFQLVITPRVRADGQILYVFNMTKNDLTQLDTYKVKGVEFENPILQLRSFGQSGIVQQGEVRETPFESATQKYVLKVTATALKN